MATRQIKSTEYIRHNYTPDERLKMGEELAAAQNRLNDVETELKVVNSQFAEKKLAAKQSIQQLSRELSMGFTMQNIGCKLIYDCPQVNEVSYVREDTGVTVKVRAMTGDELQGELPLTDREGEIEVIPPAAAEASAEKSAENIAEFFEKPAEPDGQPSTADLDVVAGDVIAAAQTGVPAAGDLWDEVSPAPVSLDAPAGDSEAQHPADAVISPAAAKKQAIRRPRGFDKPANETVW